MKIPKSLANAMCFQFIIGVLHLLFFVSVLVNNFLLFSIAFFSIPLLWLIKSIRLIFQLINIKKEKK